MKQTHSFAPLLLAAGLVGCGEAGPVTAPSAVPVSPSQPSATGSGFIWGYVLDLDQNCLKGAVVEVLDGPKSGERSEEMCDFDNGRGYQLHPPRGEYATLRASMPGYASLEKQVLIGNGGGPFNFALPRQQGL